MIVYKHLVIVLMFSLGSLGVSLFSRNFTVDDIQSEENKNQASTAANLSFMTHVNYYIQKESTPQLYLKADELKIDDNTKYIEMSAPNGDAFNDEGEVTHYKAHAGSFQQKLKILELVNEAWIKDQTSQIFADRVNYEVPKDFFEGFGSVRSDTFSPKTLDHVFINSDTVTSSPKRELGHYVGNVKGQIHRKRPFEPTIFFESDQLKLNGPASYIELISNVFLKKQEVKTWSRRGEIFLENYNKKLKYYVLYDDVRVEEKVVLADGRATIRKAFGEKLEGVVSEDKIILTGSPQVIQEKDTIKGNRITLKENNEVVEVDDSTSSFIIKD